MLCIIECFSQCLDLVSLLIMGWFCKCNIGQWITSLFNYTLRLCGICTFLWHMCMVCTLHMCMVCTCCYCELVASTIWILWFIYTYLLAAVGWFMFVPSVLFWLCKRNVHNCCVVDVFFNFGMSTLSLLAATQFCSIMLLDMQMSAAVIYAIHLQLCFIFNLLYISFSHMQMRRGARSFMRGHVRFIFEHHAVFRGRTVVGNRSSVPVAEPE